MSDAQRQALRHEGMALDLLDSGDLGLLYEPGRWFADAVASRAESLG